MRKRREKLLLNIVIGLVVICGCYFYLFEGLSSAWTKLDEDIVSLKGRLKKMESTFARKEGVNNTYERVTRNLKLDGGEEEQRSYILREINDLLASSGLEPKTRTPLATKVDGKFKVFYFDLPDIHCTPNELILFLQLLEQASSVLEVDRLIVRNFQYDGLDVKYRIDLKMSRLVYSEVVDPTSKRGRR